ncbi:hypothetical protein MRX96_021889 [Rhipicephalus microplus]
MSAAVGRGKNTPVGTGLSANERATSRRQRSPRGSARGAAVRISRWADNSWTSEPRFTLPEFVVAACPGLVARPSLCSAELCTSAAAVAPSAGIRVCALRPTRCAPVCGIVVAPKKKCLLRRRPLDISQRSEAIVLFLPPAGKHHPPPHLVILQAGERFR